MNENSKEQIPLKSVEVEDVPDDRAEPNEGVPLKSGGYSSNTNHMAEDGRNEDDTQIWYNKNMSKPKCMCVVGFTLIVCTLIVIIISITATTGPSMPIMMEPTADTRLSLLEFYPNAGNDDLPLSKRSNFIKFKRSDNSSWRPLTNELNVFLTELFKVDKIMDSDLMETPCVQENNYGYDVGKPCVVIQFNRIKDWAPDVYTREEVMEDNNGPKKLPPEMAAAYDVNDNLLFVNCEGESDIDKEMARNIVHIPMPGYKANIFPYTGSESHPFPIFVIHFANPVNNYAIGITCKIWAKNVNHDDGNEVPKGSLHFSLLIE